MDRPQTIGWRKSDRWALGCFAVALGLFTVLHLVPFSYLSSSFDSDARWEPTFGYEIWIEIIPQLIDFAGAFDTEYVTSVTWVLASVLVVASVFLIRVIAANRALWWLTALTSGATVVGLTFIVGWLLLVERPDLTYWRAGPGVACLLVFPVVHFVGVLFIRRRDPGPALAPEADAR